MKGWDDVDRRIYHWFIDLYVGIHRNSNVKPLQLRKMALRQSESETKQRIVDDRAIYTQVL